MKTVSRFEARLLRILWFFLRKLPGDQALPLVDSEYERPRCLSRSAVELVQDALGKGCMLLLTKDGGWRRERHLRGDQVKEGRLWERTPATDLGLAFSKHALEFLIWITATKPSDKQSRWTPPDNELTLGDRLLFFFAHEAMRNTEPGRKLQASAGFARQSLCWLMFPKDFADQRDKAALDFTPWTTGQGAWILEALQPRLVECWVEVERRKAQMTDWQAMQALGQTQEQVLTAIGNAADKAGRHDLARFLLQAVSQLLADNPTASAWVGGLASAGPRLADRTATHRAALALLRYLDRLRQWEQQARSVGYFDEGYAAAQLWKADWEHWQGDLLRSKAQAIIRELEPLQT